MSSYRTLHPFETPSLIFDDRQQLVHVTKYARWNDLQSIVGHTNHRTDLSDLFVRCNHCTSFLSAWKLNQRLKAFLLVNTTHHLVQQCLNDIQRKHLFGYISQIRPYRIQQTIIDNAKLAYSYDLDVDSTSFEFVLRVRSWPDDIRSTYEQRSRLWPLETRQLFDQTCFICIRSSMADVSTESHCSTCEEQLLLLPTSRSWSFTYAAIETQLTSLMSSEHRCFASICWNYVNSKSQGAIPFAIYKHVLFFFFENHPFDGLTHADLLAHIPLFTKFLVDACQRKRLPHYFNVTHNLYTDQLNIDVFTLDIVQHDRKYFSVHRLANSSSYLYRLIYLIVFQSNLFESLLTSKCHTNQILLDLDRSTSEQLLQGFQVYRQQFDASIPMKAYRPLTLECLYRYQEDNVEFILDYLSILREREPSLRTHSLWSMFIQYINSFFDDLFAVEQNEQERFMYDYHL
jgi:hypothetical protein